MGNAGNSACIVKCKPACSEMLPLKFHCHQKLKKIAPGLGERAKIKFPFTTHLCRSFFFLDESRKKPPVMPHPQGHIAEFPRGLLSPKAFSPFTKLMEELTPLNLTA